MPAFQSALACHTSPLGGESHHVQLSNVGNGVRSFSELLGCLRGREFKMQRFQMNVERIRGSLISHPSSPREPASRALHLCNASLVLQAGPGAQTHAWCSCRDKAAALSALSTYQLPVSPSSAEKTMALT